MNRFACWLVLLFVCPVMLRAEEKPKLYTPPSEGAGDSLDQATRAKFGFKYEIVDIDKAQGYVKPKVTAGSLPDRAITPAGEELGGYVLVGYVVTREGAVTDAFVIKTSDERLNSFALAATDGWRFEPAKLNGATIATIAGQEFEFGEMSAPKGFQTSQVALYQTNDVLTNRVSNVEALAGYVKQLQAILTEFFAADATPEKLSVVIAVRPDRQSRVWFVSSTRSANDEKLGLLRQKLQGVKPIEVTGGAMAFAIVGRIASAGEKTAEDGENFQPPIPSEWGATVKDAPMDIEALLNAAWPAEK